MTEFGIGDIRCFRPALVRDARDRVEAERSRLGWAMAELLASRPQATVWSGPAALAAFARNAAAVRVLGEISNRLGVMADVLAHLAERMQACLEVVRHADHRAADAGGWLNHEGQLFLPQAPAYLDPVLVAHHARQEALIRDEVERDLRQAQSLARQADHDVAKRLADAARASANEPPPAPSALAIPAPPDVRSGEYVDPAGTFASAAWWRGLTPGEKGRAISEHPEWVGLRDGLPAWARHQANLTLLGRLEVTAGADLAAVEHHRYGSQVAKRQDKQWKQHRVEALRAVRDVISRSDGVPRQLLALGESEGLVTAAVAVGDVDRADHVATFVGGFTTTVRGDLRRYDDQFTGMRREAKAIARDGADVAVVAWLGYPAPQTYEVLRTARRSVLSDTIARDQSDELAAFLTGLDAARDVPLHSTVWAHSYGSTLTGNALLRTGAVDDVALFGSPGVPFRKLEDVGLKPGALNVLVAPDDPVPKSGPLLLGLPPLSVSGAHRLATLHVKGMPNDLRTAHGHSEYGSPGTVSRRNLVAVAAGRPDLVIPASPEECRPTGGVQGPRPPAGTATACDQAR